MLGLCERARERVNTDERDCFLLMTWTAHGQVTSHIPTQLRRVVISIFDIFLIGVIVIVIIYKEVQLR
jgi:hypothetical protein